MTQILLVCARAPARPGLEEALPALAAAGVTVQVCLQNPIYRVHFAGMPSEEIHVLSRKPLAGRPTSRWSPVRIALGVEWRAHLLRMRRSGPAVKLWLLASRDAWFRQTVSESQVIVAMDRLSVYTVWRANRLKGDHRVFYGLPAALRHLALTPVDSDD